MKQQVNTLEQKLAKVMENTPKLPENAKKWIVKYLPWMALIFGALQALATLSLWNLGHRANDIINVSNQYARAYGVSTGVNDLNLFYWIAVIFLGISAAMLLLAYPGLRDHKKVGWNWLFYSSLLNAVYGVTAMFFDGYYGGGVSRLFGAAIGTAISLWILFQIRGSYKTDGNATETSN